jgi:hypothetical protein
MFYNTPLKDMTGISFDDGTSAATPLWVVEAGEHLSVSINAQSTVGCRL